MFKTDFVGIELKNPVIVAAGPWCRDGKSLVKAIKAGAGAVVTESVVSDTLPDMRPYVTGNSEGSQNIKLYSELQIENWEKEIAMAKNAGGVVFGSVSAQTASEIAYLAVKMEKYGCDAIEVSVGNPAKEALEVIASKAELVYEITKEVVSQVKVPVVVKLSQNTTNISKVAKAVKAAGGSGISAINAVRGILSVDIETARPSLNTYGGISGEYIRPLGLSSVATIAQSVDIPIAGIGGISSARNALEYIMLGASAVEIGSVVMREGYDVIGKITKDLEAWAHRHRVYSVHQICGRALDNMKSFDEMRVVPIVSTVNNAPCEEGCDICLKICRDEAISKEGDVVTANREKCSGCGVCTFRCPAKKFRLDW